MFALIISLLFNAAQVTYIYYLTTKEEDEKDINNRLN